MTRRSPSRIRRWSVSGCISMASSVGSMRPLHHMQPMPGAIKRVVVRICPTSPSEETGIFTPT
ncbi:hypothetical protein AQJ84_08825 [Streptomyces resistomycificus]|uniref:Uncharacterized protein n=1 Tax=Streptomyces resistomycificus TaxID=67356 RepID=A0A0L8LZZ4_9ACTN|nr:hypothetical protein ADK37_00455 [Streptomyces resistomycificus]KUO00213.1 hypothetical protein AQJ84_08825 [Streptomyces resistomycificus]